MNDSVSDWNATGMTLRLKIIIVAAPRVSIIEAIINGHNGNVHY